MKKPTPAITIQEALKVLNVYNKASISKGIFGTCAAMRLIPRMHQLKAYLVKAVPETKLDLMAKLEFIERGVDGDKAVWMLKESEVETVARQVREYVWGSFMLPPLTC